MNRDELERALDRWGADLRHWPPADAARARALLSVDPEAERLADAAARVAAFLRDLPDPQPAPHLAARIVARARAGRVDVDRAAEPLDRALQWLLGRGWRPALLALALAATGYLAGTAAPPELDSSLADDVVTLAFSDLYAELEDAQP